MYQTNELIRLRARKAVLRAELAAARAAQLQLFLDWQRAHAGIVLALHWAQRAYRFYREWFR